VAAHRSKPLPVLRFTKFDKVFTYDIVVTRGTQFADLGTTVAAGDGEAVRSASGVDASMLRCSFGEDESTKGGGGLRRSIRKDGWPADQLPWQ
jgi:hypothetical protein